MASRHTEHYGLSQWEASDKVERTDFNADNAAVDGALHALAQSKAETAAAFLPVYDNLERAVSTEGDEDSPHKKGLEMIFHQYQEILKKLGVTEIEAQGAPFDPEKHNAVMHVEDESVGENTIVEVFQQGYELGDKVLRFAMVKVAN